jgi:hypothetical protein
VPADQPEKSAAKKALRKQFIHRRDRESSRPNIYRDTIYM